MTASDEQSLIAILRYCATAAPEPWYPSVHARTQGIDRDSLDPVLERLRLGRLIQLTDWVQGTGQGYRLTAEGQHALQTPRVLQLLQRDQLPEPKREPEPSSSQPPNTYERGEILRAALETPIVPYVSYGLLLATLGVFLAGVQLARQERILDDYLNHPGQPAVTEVLHKIGALKGADLMRGEWWRLLTCCFVHFGLIHLGVNGITLFSLGPYLEQLWGRARFLAVYLIAGLAGSCAMVLSHPTSLGAGASGALWGLMISQAAWVFLNRRHLPPINPSWVRRFVVIILINVFISSLPNISAAAHFAGGAAGLAASVLLNLERFSVGPRRWLLLFLTALLPVACVGTVVYQMRHDPQWRVLQYQAFDAAIPTRVKTELEYPTTFYKENLKPLLDQHADRRDPEQVEKAVTALAKQRLLLAQIDDRLSRLGNDAEPNIEATRQAGLDVTRAAAEFYQLADRALRPNEGEKVNDAELKRRQEEVEQLGRKWHNNWMSLQAARRELDQTAGR